MHGADELQENLEAARILADHGHNIELLPLINENMPDMRSALLPDVFGTKNPDIRIDSVMIGDIKTPSNQIVSRSVLTSQISSCANQKVQIAVLNLSGKDYVVSDIKTAIMGSINDPNRNKSVQEVWIITKSNNLFKATRQMVAAKTIYSIIEGLE